MDGEANWVLMLVIVFAAAGLLALIAFSKTAFERFQARKVALPCPETGTSFEGVVEKDLVSGKRKVVRCDRFDNPCEVSCAQTCLRDIP